MQASNSNVFTVGDLEIDLARGCVSRDGAELHLRRKSFQVLAYLLERRDRLVSKDELFEALWRDTAVTDDVLVQCIKEVRRTLGDDSHNPRLIKTVPRSGYRFIGPVEPSTYAEFTEEITRVEFEFEEDTSGQRRLIPHFPALPGTTRRLDIRRIALGAAAFCAVAVLVYIGWTRAAGTADVRLPQIAGRESVAVMFFHNASGDKDLDWLREGLADMLITNLSRSDRLTVLSRQQLSALLERTGNQSAGLPTPLETSANVAAKSGANVVITGSFARVGEKVRIDVQIHDAATSSLRASESLTADRAENILTDIDLLSLRISRRLSGEGGQEHQLARAMTDNLEAYRCYSLAVEKAHGLELVEAIQLLERAIELDPEFAMAHGRLGYVYAVAWSRLPEGRPHLERAFQLSSRLTEKDRMSIGAWYALANNDYEAAIKAYREIIARYPLETEAYLRLGRLLAGEEKVDEAIDVLQRGLVVDADSKELHNVLGGNYSRLGRHREAIASHERYVALAPEDPNPYDSLGLSLQWAGEFDRAAEAYQHALRINPRFEIARVHLGNVRLRQGRYREALEAYNAYRDTAPSEGESSRALASIAIVHLLKRDIASAEAANSEAVSLAGEFTAATTAIAKFRGDRETLKRTAESHLNRGALPSRGSRLSKRFDHYYRAQLAFVNGDLEAGLAELRRTVEASPVTWHFSDYEDALGLALLELGRYDEAIVEFNRVLAKSPNYPLARYHIAWAYEHKGALSDARSQYLAFLEEWRSADKDVPEVVAARKFVKRTA